MAVSFVDLEIRIVEGDALRHCWTRSFTLNLEVSMQTIAVPDLNRFLLEEACAHTRTWLRALRWSPARKMLSELLARAEVMIPQVGTGVRVADAACELAQTLEMDDFGIGGNTEFPSELWPQEFAQNPWDRASDWPGMAKDQVRIRWERWNLRRDSFRILTHRVRCILRAIEHFDNPQADTSWRYSGQVAPGYESRYALARQIAVPDIAHHVTVSARRAAGDKLEGREVNDLAVRAATPVDWLHVENGEGASHNEETLTLARAIAWQQGRRGMYFARSCEEDTRILLWKPRSDMRLRCWVPDDVWADHCREIVILPT